VARKALDTGPQLAELAGSFGGGLTDDLGDLSRERGGQPGDRPGRPGLEPRGEKRLGADEDVEAFDEIRPHLLEGRV
jgi:hypothetical protein